MMSHQGENTTVRRAIWLEAGGDPAMRAYPKCGNWRCVNPEHVHGKTQTEHMKTATRSHIRRIALSKSQLARCGKLTDAQVMEIQVAPGTHVSIAQEYGVSQSYVSAIKNGKRRKHVANPWAGLGSRK